MKTALLSLLQCFGSWCRRWEARFYLLLAAAIAVLLLADYSLQGMMGRGSEVIYDRLVKLRISSPAPDPRIVIIDIDERSLQEVGRDQGRWPWSNSVVAEALAASPDRTAVVTDRARRRWEEEYSPEAGRRRVAQLLDRLGVT